MTELELLIDFHKDAERQGPGSHADTLKALSFIQIDKNKIYKILDIGCGSGSQTFSLVNAIDAQIIAVDLYPEFLDKLNETLKKHDWQNKITTLQKSMDDLPFDKQEFDIIWSEGAIYNIGFENGIKKWKEFLKSGGYIAVSEITWLTNERPAEIEEYWNNEYSEMDTASNKIKILETNGFTLLGYFVLPESSWLDNYYQPIENRMNTFLEKHSDSEIAKIVIEKEREEIKKYKKYKQYFGYGFYIAQKWS
jgi:ubiquinone/menaquinone biosynthesis C-methylase UbiE